MAKREINQSKSYQTYVRLCREKNVSDYAVSKSTNVSTSVLSQWKYNVFQIKIDKLILIADYFNEPITSFL